MIIIGVLLVAAAVVFGVDLILKNHHAHMISPVVFGHSLGLTSEAALFILGAITGAAVLFGLALVVAGMRYRRIRVVRRRGELGAVNGTRGERQNLTTDYENAPSELGREREPTSSHSMTPADPTQGAVSAGGASPRDSRSRFDTM